MDTLSLQPHQRYFNVLEKVNKKIKKKERKEERKIVYFYFMCMCLSVHVYTYPILAWYLLGARKRYLLSWNQSYDSCELPCGCWAQNMNPLHEQQALLTAEPSFQCHLFLLLIFILCMRVHPFLMAPVLGDLMTFLDSISTFTHMWVHTQRDIHTDTQTHT